MAMTSDKHNELRFQVQGRWLSIRGSGDLEAIRQNIAAVVGESLRDSQSRLGETRPRAPAMLCLHQTTRIGKGEPAGLGGLKNLHYAHELAQRGYVCLVPDYPSFGDYDFDFAATGRLPSGSMKAIWNNIRGVDLLESLPEVDGDAYATPRTGGVQPIGDLMAQVLARYLPAEDVWQERSRIALQSVRAAAG